MAACNNAVRHFELPALTLSFESLIANPHQEISQLAAFAGIPLAAELLDTICHSLTKEKALSYQHSAPLRDFAETKKEPLAKYGYTSDI